MLKFRRHEQNSPKLARNPRIRGKTPTLATLLKVLKDPAHHPAAQPQQEQTQEKELTHAEKPTRLPHEREYVRPADAYEAI